jgi:hypothetical protein
VGQRAPDRAALAYAHVADLPYRLGEHRSALGDELGVLEVDVPNQRRENEPAVGELDRALVGPADVDERGRRREVQHHHRNQALAAGDHVGLVAELLEALDRLGPRLRAEIVEGGRVHRA